MKKILLPVILALIVSDSFCQKHSASIEGKAFNIGIYYLSPTRSQFDAYINTISTTLGLTGSIKPTVNIGGSFAFSFRTGKNEIEAGGGLAFGMRNIKTNAGSSNTAALSNKTFDIHFGYNSFVGGPLFLGFDFGVINNGGKLEVVTNSSTLFESTPSSSNPFKGYVFNVKPKAGLFFPFSKKEYSGLKFTAFYDLGLTKYQFYTNDIFDSRLKNYTGETKSSYNAFGAQASLVIGLNK